MSPAFCSAWDQVRRRLDKTAAGVNNVDEVVGQINDCPDSLVERRRPEWRKRGLALPVLRLGRRVRSERSVTTRDETPRADRYSSKTVSPE